MLFNSGTFLIFFPVVLVLYFLAPVRLRQCLLLAASVYFYCAYIPQYFFILLAGIIVDWLVAQRMERAVGKDRKLYLAISLITNLGFLTFFKYSGWLADSINQFSQILGLKTFLPVLKIALPLGISFHTFQTISYVVEVYRGKVAAEKSFWRYALYVLFFPQLVAGPIERPGHMLPQYQTPRELTPTKIVSGLRLMLWGFLKKVVIADRAASLVETVYSNPNSFGSWSIAMATFLFAIQIYADFSGYSDIAVGAARILGYDLVKNFARPYLATSIRDFWSRWHISLSQWLRDYVYIPLGGNRVSAARAYANTMIVFLLSGLWHGASWHFVLWGAIHGLYLWISRASKTIRTRLVTAFRLNYVPPVHRVLQIFYTLFLVCFAWIFFRAPSLGAALEILKQFGQGGSFSPWQHNLALDSPSRLLIVLTVSAFVFGVEYLAERGSLSTIFFKRHKIIRWLAYALVFWLILFFGQFGEKQFIYFVF